MKDTRSLAAARFRRTALAWTTVSLLALLPSAGSLVAYTARLRAGHRRTLRVCADPNNLPFSNQAGQGFEDRKSTRLNSSHPSISYAVFCLKKKKNKRQNTHA